MLAVKNLSMIISFSISDSVSNNYFPLKLYFSKRRVSLTSLNNKRPIFGSNCAEPGFNNLAKRRQKTRNSILSYFQMAHISRSNIARIYEKVIFQILLHLQRIFSLLSLFSKVFYFDLHFSWTWEMFFWSNPSLLVCSK